MADVFKNLEISHHTNTKDGAIQNEYYLIAIKSKDGYTVNSITFTPEQLRILQVKLKELTIPPYYHD